MEKNGEKKTCSYADAQSMNICKCFNVCSQHLNNNNNKKTTSNCIFDIVARSRSRCDNFGKCVKTLGSAKSKKPIINALECCLYLKERILLLTGT